MPNVLTHEKTIGLYLPNARSDNSLYPLNYTKRIMKSFHKILIAAALLAWSIPMLAQTEWKEKPVTLRVSNQPLGKVLEMVAETAGAKITLQEVSLWNINKPTSIVVKDKPLDKVLGELIGDQNIVIRYEDGNHIVVLPDTQYATEKVELNVTGQVFDKDTGEPLIGATVLITDGTGKDKGARGCITDFDGKFSIRLAKKEPKKKEA